MQAGPAPPVTPSSSEGRFESTLRGALLLESLVLFDENLSASYTTVSPAGSTHHPTYAAIALSSRGRLVVFAMGAKRIDIPIASPQWRRTMRVFAAQQDIVTFTVDTSALTSFACDSVEIRVRTSIAQFIVAAYEEAGMSLVEGIAIQTPAPFNSRPDEAPPPYDEKY